MRETSHYLVEREQNGGVPGSRHVSVFVEFAEMTIEILDSAPTYVEENLET